MCMTEGGRGSNLNDVIYEWSLFIQTLNDFCLTFHEILQLDNKVSLYISACK